MSNDRIKAFIEESKAEAAKFESKQKSIGTEPLLKDVTSNFNKNKTSITIGERDYIIKKFGILDTMALIPILGASFLVPLSSLLRQGSEEGESGISGLTEGLHMLFQNIDNGELEKIFYLLLGDTTVEGKVVELEEDFDDIADVFQVCIKVLEISFGNFIKSLGLQKLTSWGEAINNLQK